MIPALKNETAILLHGVCDAEEYFEMDFPSPSNAHWLPWLQQKFLRSGMVCQSLEMPATYQPVYANWRKTFSQINTDDLAIVVGHSAGCGFILKYLAENPAITLKKLVLVAPYKDPYQKYGDFLQGPLDPDLEKRVGEIHILYSTNESTKGVAETKDTLMALYKTARLHTFADKDHFCLSDLGGPEFPELWDICKD